MKKVEIEERFRSQVNEKEACLVSKSDMVTVQKK
jgi:hypothetical protein